MPSDREPDVTELVDAADPERRLVELKQHEAFLDLLPDPVFTTDRTGRVTYVNEAFAEVFGHADPDELRLSAFLTEKSVDDAVELLRELATDGTEPACRTVELEGVTETGRVRTFAASVASFRHDGDFGGATALLRDVTAQKRREEVFEVMDRALRHNLRTNVAVITGYAGTLREELDDEQLTEDHRTGLARIGEAAEWIETLGQSMRTLQTAVGEPLAAPQRVRIERVIESAVEAATPADVDVDLSVTVAVTGELEAGEAVEIAVEHVVENAIVHSDAETPTVDVWVTRSPRDRWVDIHVADEGPGIPEFEREVVLGDASVDQLQHSSGLGLWMTRWIVDMFDGKLEIEDNDPRGTVVTMRFPMLETTADNPD